MKEHFLFGDFMRSIIAGDDTDSIAELESEAVQGVMRRGLLLVGGITILFIPLAYWFFESLTMFSMGVFLFCMWTAAFLANYFNKKWIFSAILAYSILGSTVIFAVTSHDNRGYFVAGLSIFLLSAQFLLPPRLYYLSLLPVLGFIFFQMLGGSHWLFSEPLDTNNQALQIANVLMWLLVFVTATQIVRNSFITTLANVVSLVGKLETTKTSLVKANENLDNLNKSLEDRINQRTQDLQNALAKAEAANIAKDRFLATMSHELRTPLNAIIGYSEDITDVVDLNPADALAEIDSAADRVLTSGKNLLSIINNILEISQIESGSLPPSPNEVKLDALLREIQILVSPIIEENGNVLKISNASGLMDIYTDKLKFQRILVNLLSNAAKFTQNGVVELNICPIRKDRIQFEVKDNGIGISPQKLELIFEPFAQASEGNMYSRP
ncbi:MAG: histidine kinase dimerization/phospho-acceptor domain-containing protein, partial [Chloroflexota bacterium]